MGHAKKEKLTPREKAVIDMRDGGEKTWKVIAEHFKVSQTRVTQIYRKAKKWLKEN